MTMTTVEELAAPAWRSGSAIVLTRAQARWRGWLPAIVIAPFVAIILASYAVPWFYQLQGKRLLVEATAEAAAADGTIAAAEGELLRAFAACWDCPLPPMWLGRGA